MTSLAPGAHFLTLQLSVSLASAPSPQPLIGPHTEEAPRPGQGKNTDVDTGLLLWLQLTGVNSNHKAGRTALCVCLW